MVALLETVRERISAGEKMRRLIRGDDGVKYIDTEISGLRVLRVTVPLPISAGEKTAAKKLCRVMEALDRASIKKVMFKDDFFLPEVIREQHFSELDDKLLWNMKAAEIARLAAPKGVRAAVAADKMGRFEIEAVEKLCLSFRYVCFKSCDSGAEMCRRLCRELGVSVIEKPADKVMSAADTAIIFDGADKVHLGEKCVTVSGGEAGNAEGSGRFVKRAEFSCDKFGTEELPGGFAKDPILALGVENRVFMPEDIKITGISLEKNA